MSAEHKIKQGVPRVGNEGKESQYSVQSVDLITEDSETVARIDAYRDSEFYSAYWMTTLSPDKLVALAEKTIQHYESQYTDGVKGVDGQNHLPSGEDIEERSKGVTGVIYYAKDRNNGNSVRDDELPYERPLNWQRIQDDAGESDVTFARINTPIGNFCLMLAEAERFNFGVISHLAQTSGFSNLITESTQGNINQEDAERLFDAMVSIFGAKQDPQSV